MRPKSLTKECVVCGGDFHGRSIDKYCSDACRSRVICRVDGCVKTVHAIGLCGSHYYRHLKWGQGAAGRIVECGVCSRSFITATRGKLCSDECLRVARLARGKERRQHPSYAAKHAEYARERRRKNPAAVKRDAKITYTRHKEKLLDYRKEWGARNRAYLREYDRRYCKERRRTDPLFRLQGAVRIAVRRMLNGAKKSATFEMLDYSVSALKEHLERQFTGRMSWLNYGEHWEIDHIVPIASFSMEQVRECWSLTNLRPLEKHENRAKGSMRVYLL